MLRPCVRTQVIHVAKKNSAITFSARRNISTTRPACSDRDNDAFTPQFTHLSSSGDARMVSIAAKPTTSRVAVAVATVHFSPSQTSTSELLSTAASKKGDILAVARVAGIQAAKQTSTIIPLCHNIPLSSVEVGLEVLEGKVEVNCRVECVGSTGVEMEALCGVMGAGLCVYDMCKSVDKGMRIDGVKVVEKRGGKSGDWVDGKQVGNSSY